MAARYYEWRDYNEEAAARESARPDHLIGRRVKFLRALRPQRVGKLGLVERLIWTRFDANIYGSDMPKYGWVAVVAEDDRAYLVYLPVEWLRPINLGFGQWVKTIGKGAS